MLVDRKSYFVNPFTRKKRATWNCVLFLLAFCFVSNLSLAQVYPVQATVQLTPPYSLYLADYVDSGSERLALNIFLSDIARPDLDVRFRLKIIGQGITLETKPGYIPPPVSIQGGVPLRLISTDLAEYFNPNNLTFQGLSQREYAQRGKLPEGVYQFCFEVLEYNRGLKISNTACAVAWLVLNDPPIVNLPRQEEKLKAQSLQNVMFQWTPRHTGSPNSAFTTEYEIKMVEVWPATRNPNDAVLTSPPILEETTRNTTFIYGPGETPLEPGRRYAFRVQAKSISGVDELDLFKNHGYSEVVSFVYGDACDLPTGISIESVGPSRFALRWESMFNHTAFKVRYRQEGTVDWYEDNVSIESTQILSLKPSTTYEYQVAATCGFFDGDYSPIARVTTAEEVPVDYSCGIPLTPFNLDPSELTGSLKPGDIIQAGDFQVQLISVNGSNGIFSGEGIIEVPYLNKAKVKTSFTNITVSKELRMVNGFMNVTGAAVDVVPQEILDGMEQLSEVLEVVDTALNIIEENIPEQIDWNSFVADTLVAVSGEIIGVNKNEDGRVTVTTSNGQTQTLPAGNNYALKDEAGNGYLVDKNGNVHATTSDVATKLANREYNLLVTFREDAISNYGFDQSGLNPPDDTEVLPKGDEKKGYNVAWKSVASGRVDGVIAGLEGSGIDKSKIRFELGGIDVQAPPLGPDQTARVVVTGKSGGSFEELLALYTPSDTSKVQVLGKLKVASYDELRRKLVIVPVNNSILPKEMTAQSIQDSLNAIYHQAVVHWEVEVKPAISVALNDQFDDGGSGLLSNYTGDMKKVINAYGTLEEDTYYLFLVRNPSSGLGLGYMPRGKEAGFIFVDKHGSAQALVRTMAHEVGHGAFNLAHTFDEVNFPITKGNSDNLMDYPAGDKLYKYQWDKMRYPDIVVGLFEEDDAGQIREAIDYKCLPATLTKVHENEYYYDLNGEIVLLDKNYEPYSFVGTGDKDDKHGALAIIRETTNGKLYYPAKNNDQYKSYYARIGDGGLNVKDELKLPVDNNARPTVVFVDNNCSYIIDRPGDSRVVTGQATSCGCFQAAGASQNYAANQEGSALFNFSGDELDEEFLQKLFTGKDQKIVSNQTRHSLKAILFITDGDTYDEKKVFIENYVIPVGYIQIWLHNGINGWEIKSELPPSLKNLLADQSLEKAFGFSCPAQDSNGKSVYTLEDFNTPLQATFASLDYVATAYYELFDALQVGIRELRIPEYAWNCNDADKYQPVYAYVYRFITLPLNPYKHILLSVGGEQFARAVEHEHPQLATELRRITNGQAEFALICGVWNGLVETIASVPDVGKLLWGSLSCQGRSDFGNFWSQLKRFEKEDETGELECSGAWCAIKTGLVKQFSGTCQVAEMGGEVAFIVIVSLVDPVAAEALLGKGVSTAIKIIRYCDAFADKFNPAAWALRFTNAGAKILKRQSGQVFGRIIGEDLVAVTTTGETIRVPLKNVVLEDSDGGLVAKVSEGDAIKTHDLLEEGAIENGISFFDGLSNSIGKSKVLSKVLLLKNAKAFIERLDEVADAALLKKLEELSDLQLQKLDELYSPSTFQRPGAKYRSPNNVEGDYWAKTRDGRHDIYFDKYGYPDLTSANFGPGKDFAYNSQFLTGKADDFGKATAWLKAKFKDRADVLVEQNDTNVDVTIDNVTNTYTWHHHEDGQTLILVLTDVHSNVAHTGGAAIITRYLQGLFNSPF